MNLLKCPGCGSADISTFGSWVSDQKGVECKGCGASVIVNGALDAATKAWNLGEGLTTADGKPLRMLKEFDYPEHQVYAMVRRLARLFHEGNDAGLLEAGIRVYWENGLPAYALSEGLSKALRDMRDEHYLLVLALLALTVRRVRAMSREDGIRWLHAEADRAMAAWVDPEGQLRPTCRKGCAACCHMMVMASPTEVDLALALPGAQVDAEQARRLGARDPYNQDEYLKGTTFAERRCPFLAADNTCSVYEARPLACRNHMSVDDPVLCDPIASGEGAALRHVLSYKAQILSSVIFQLEGEDCRSLASLVAARLPVESRQGG